MSSPVLGYSLCFVAGVAATLALESARSRLIPLPLEKKSERAECPVCPVCPEGPQNCEAPSVATIETPLLPAPQLDRKMPERFESNLEGEVYLRWERVLGAKSYVVEVVTLEGAVKKTYRTENAKIFLKEIPLQKAGQPSHYRLRLATVNAKNAVGPFGGPRDLIVKPPMNLSAPTIREIRIED